MTIDRTPPDFFEAFKAVDTVVMASNPSPETLGQVKDALKVFNPSISQAYLDGPDFLSSPENNKGPEIDARVQAFRQAFEDMVNMPTSQKNNKKQRPSKNKKKQKNKASKKSKRKNRTK